MADKYLSQNAVSNHFDYVGSGAGAGAGCVLEDVDDEFFLNNSRTNNAAFTRGPSVSQSAGYGGRPTASKRSTNPFDESYEPYEEQQQAYAERRRQLESSTLDSTQKSLKLLYETQEVGQATAVELAKQREQLEKSTRQLDEIRTSLRFSQRHLNGLKSVFGGLKNYLTGGSRDAPSPHMSGSPSGSNITGLEEAAAAEPYASPNFPPTMSPTERYDSHPISRIRDDSTSYQQRWQAQEQRRTNPFEQQLEANLDEMCGNLSRLKFLATDLGTEIESQNELLDNMNYKIEDVDIIITKQNKDMNKLLK